MGFQRRGPPERRTAEASLGRAAAEQHLSARQKERWGGREMKAAISEPERREADGAKKGNQLEGPKGEAPTGPLPCSPKGRGAQGVVPPATQGETGRNRQGACMGTRKNKKDREEIPCPCTEA